MEEKKSFKNADKKAKKNFILTIIVMAVFLFLMLSGNMLNGNAARINDTFLKCDETAEIPKEYRIAVKDVKCITEGLDVERIKEYLLNDKLEPLFIAVISYDCTDLSGAGREALVPEYAGTGKEDGHAVPENLVPGGFGGDAPYHAAFVFYYADDIVQYKFFFHDAEDVLQNVYVTADTGMK